MRLSDQVRALEEENTRLRAALAAEQDKRRKWQGALNRAEATIAREVHYHQAQVEADFNAEDYATKLITERGIVARQEALVHIADARAEARKETSQ